MPESAPSIPDDIAQLDSWLDEGESRFADLRAAAQVDRERHGQDPSAFHLTLHLTIPAH